MERSYQYDAFISHAVEDKIAFANDLEKALINRGAKIWYSGNELNVGDVLEESIREGWEHSRYGIVIISPRYVNKFWPLTEFAAFYLRPGSETTLLPVLLDMTPEEAARYAPIGKLFSVSASRGVDFVADKLIQRMGKHKPGPKVRSRSQWLKIFIAVFAIATLVVLFLVTKDVATGETITTTVEKRIKGFSDLVAIETEKYKATGGYLIPVPDEISTAYGRFLSSTRYRNEYELQTGISRIKSKKNVEEALGLDLDLMTPLNSFGMDSCAIYVKRGVDEAGREILELKYINLTPVTYLASEQLTGIGQTLQKISFNNNLRLLTVRMAYSLSATDSRKYEVTIHGLLPEETFSFVKTGGIWKGNVSR